jgi:hypothetical protein
MLMAHNSPLEKRIFGMLAVLIGIIFYPTDAFAWGPVAHIDFSLQILCGAAALAPSIHALISRRRNDFIYGNLAADAVVGKNFAARLAHSHSWNIARELLAEARQTGEDLEAFMLGYVAHLGADVIAHNHFVPFRLVDHYQKKGVGHLYWEARFDQKLLRENPNILCTWRELAKTRFLKHDRFLAVRLAPTVFSNTLSTQIYHRSLGVQCRRPWQNALERNDNNSSLKLRCKEMLKWRAVSVAMAAQALNDPLSDELDFLDPTGLGALSSALSHRRLLRRRFRRSSQDAYWRVLMDKKRPAFTSTYPPPGYILDHTA